MCKSKSFFILGIISGAVSFISCLIGSEILQYAAAFICLIAFLLTDRYKNRHVRTY